MLQTVADWSLWQFITHLTIWHYLCEILDATIFAHPLRSASSIFLILSI